jgi:hypothetical protein
LLLLAIAIVPFYPFPQQHPFRRDPKGSAFARAPLRVAAKRMNADDSHFDNDR